MPAEAAKEHNPRLMMKIMFFIGLAIFVFLMAVAGYVVWTRYHHAQTWLPVEAKVVGLVTRCDVEYKSGKNWNTATTLPCEQADAYIDANKGFMRNNWRKTPREHATISYSVNGVPQGRTLNRFLISSEPVSAGATVPILVDPADYQSVDRANSASDISLLWIMAAVGLGIWAFMILVGFYANWINARQLRKKAQEAAG